MKKVKTPLYFHVLFVSLIILSLSVTMCIYQVESLLQVNKEVVILLTTVYLSVVLVLYGGCVYYFRRQYTTNESVLFRKVKQNNAEYYLPTEVEKSLFVNEQVRDLYNEMAADFMEMMESEKHRQDTAISYVHDMKLPLTTLSLLLDKIEPEISYDDYLTAQSSIQRLNKYISEQLYLSQLSDLTNNLYYEYVDINSIWVDVIQELQTSILMKKLKITKQGESSIVRGDRRMIHFIFMQLLQNAIQYTETGEITILIQENSCKIIDSGVGIPDYEMPLIFKRGYTGKVYRKKKQSGMGLYLVSRLAEVLDIQVSVQSEETKGTTFKLDFDK